MNLSTSQHIANGHALSYWIKTVSTTNRQLGEVAGISEGTIRNLRKSTVDSPHAVSDTVLKFCHDAICKIASAKQVPHPKSPDSLLLLTKAGAENALSNSVALLRESRMDTRADRAIKRLDVAIDILADLPIRYHGRGVVGLSSVQSSCLHERADLERNPAINLDLPKRAFEWSLASCTITRHPEDILACAGSVCDYFWPFRSAGERVFVFDALTTLDGLLKQSISSLYERSETVTRIAHVFVALAKLSRLKSRLDAPRLRTTWLNKADRQLQTIDQEVRNNMAAVKVEEAMLALENAPSTGSSVGRFRLQHRKPLRRLRDAANLGLNSASLIRATIYRKIREFESAVDEFKLFHDGADNLRHVYRQVSTLAESARGIWYGCGCPASPLESVDAKNRARLKYALNTTQEAVNAGYCSPRIMLAVIFLEAICVDTANRSNKTLRQLGTIGGDDVLSYVRSLVGPEVGSAGLDWGPVKEAFGIGIDECGFWNSLGTFAKDIVGDLNTAAFCYEIAAGFADPGANIGRFNLAVTLYELGRIEDSKFALSRIGGYVSPLLRADMGNFKKAVRR